MRRYVGARYMPKFMGEYNPTTAYEALSVVDNGQGTSYISNKPVPAGTPLTNTLYWVIYGTTSGAILNLQEQIDAINSMYVTPQMFGALGDDNHDDSAAVQAALDDAFTNNKVLFIPCGTYKITSSLNGHHKVNIVGADKYHTILKWYGEDGNDVITFDGNDNNMSNLTFRHIDYAPETRTPTTTTKAVNASGYSHNIFSNIIIKGFACGFYVYNDCWCTTITDCWIESCSYGIRGRSEFNNINIDRTSIIYCDYGIWALSGRGVNINGCAIEHCSSGVYLADYGNYHIVGNYFESNFDYSIQIQWANSSISVAEIRGNMFFVGQLIGANIGYHASPSAIIDIEDNFFNSYNLTSDKPALIPLLSTSITPTFKNNKFGDHIVLGVTLDKIAGYYDNATRHVKYLSSADMSAKTNEMGTTRFAFDTAGTITLPDFRTFNDPKAEFCFLGFSTSAADDAQMPISRYLSDGTTMIDIVGKQYIVPNTIYHCYFNQVTASGHLEVILVK